MLKYILCFIYILNIFLVSKNYFLFFQLDSYQFPSFFRTVRRNYKRIYSSSFYLIIIFLLDNLLFSNSLYIRLIYNLFTLAISIYIRKYINIQNPKKDLVYTNRIKRLIIVYFIFLFLIALQFYNYTYLLAIFLLPIFSVSALIAWPIEKMISEYYFYLARTKLSEMKNLIKIGITGSYGKTSTKNIMGNILNSYIPTLISPRSYNTPMGLTITIRKFLSPSYRAFIAEMGSRHIGDINKLCKLVKPTIGIITAVGPQHLDTFKTVANVTKAKYELIENLPEKNGVAFFQDDNGIVRDLFNRTKIEKYISSLYDNNADIYISNISIDSYGSSFSVFYKKKHLFDCKTCLLGENNIKNIAISIAVAKYLNIPDFLIKKSISELLPTKSRLELIKTDKYTIINDAFNSNISGSKEALRVLSKFEGRKIIITPGMVELGNQEKSLNYEFGKEIAKVADIVILVGKSRAIPIKNGLLDVKFNPSNIYVVSSLKDSTEILNKIVNNDDVVLYENDLPDNYIDA